MTKAKEFISKVGMPRIIIVAFLLLITVTAFIQGQDMAVLASDVLVRYGMNGVLALAMVPAVISGTGLNFGLPLGILAGILGGLISMEMKLTGFTGVFVAIIVALPFSVLFGALYGKLLNGVKGSEMVVGTYVGYSAVSLMCIFWLILPFKHQNVIWPIGGKGLRTTISLEAFYDKIFNKLGAFTIGGVKVPTGLLVVFFICCFLMYLFTRSKLGVSMEAVGSNPLYAVAAGINVDRMRMLGTIMSTSLGAIGIIMYAQAFGFYQMYNAALFMAYPAVAAVLLGGASTTKINIGNVLLGTLLFQALLTVALPVANQLAPEGGLSEIARITVSNGIILYALTQSGGKK